MIVNQASIVDLTVLLQEAQKNHHPFEEGLGHPDSDWAGWYAAYVTARQSGLPEEVASRYAATLHHEEHRTAPALGGGYL